MNNKNVFLSKVNYPKFIALSIIIVTSLMINIQISNSINNSVSSVPLDDNFQSIDPTFPMKLLPNFNENLNRLIYQLTFDIQPNAQDIFITALITYQNNNNMSIANIVYVADIETILVESRISSFLIYDSEGALYFEWTTISNFHLLNITLRDVIEYNDYYTFSISYLLENAILASLDIENNFVLQWSIFNDEDVDQFAVIVTLPNDYSLGNSTIAAPLEPEADYVSVDERRFEWSFYNIPDDEVLSWIVRFQTFESPIIPSSKIPAYIWVLMVVLFFVGGIVGSVTVSLIYKSRSDLERKEIVETLLSQPEKDILKIIKDEGGTTTQSKICSLAGFSKAKVSYYINKLDQKAIISRERWGRMNRIRIVDDTYEKVYFDEIKKEKVDEE
ncbi:MAG: helix-turn-helix transcriptional regulator [Candidatus Heimdallarchaeota archaeon]